MAGKSADKSPEFASCTSSFVFGPSIHQQIKDPTPINTDTTKDDVEGKGKGMRIKSDSLNQAINPVCATSLPRAISSEDKTVHFLTHSSGTVEVEEEEEVPS